MLVFYHCVCVCQSYCYHGHIGLSFSCGAAVKRYKHHNRIPKQKIGSRGGRVGGGSWALLIDFLLVSLSLLLLNSHPMYYFISNIFSFQLYHNRIAILHGLYKHAGRCVGMLLVGYAEAQASGAQHSFAYLEGEFASTSGVSAVFVEQLNAFEGQLHQNTDDWVFRFWDDGSKTMPRIGWEGHDEGDIISPNGRKLASSVAARFVSAGLRIFGI